MSELKYTEVHVAAGYFSVREVDECIEILSFNEFARICSAQRLSRNPAWPDFGGDNILVWVNGITVAQLPVGNRVSFYGKLDTYTMTPDEECQYVEKIIQILDVFNEGTVIELRHNGITQRSDAWQIIRDGNTKSMVHVGSYDSDFARAQHH